VLGSAAAAGLLFGNLTLSKSHTFFCVPKPPIFWNAVSPLNLRRSPYPRRNGTAGVKKSENSRFFLTGRQFDNSTLPPDFSAEAANWQDDHHAAMAPSAAVAAIDGVASDVLSGWDVIADGFVASARIVYATRAWFREPRNSRIGTADRPSGAYEKALIEGKVQGRFKWFSAGNGVSPTKTRPEANR
jgi:hypothetical protein